MSCSKKYRLVLTKGMMLKEVYGLCKSRETFKQILQVCSVDKRYEALTKSW